MVLHVSPHPDDELLGAPAALMALRDAGHRVVNLAVSLGRARDRGRRGDEVERAGRRAGFDVVIATPPVDISGDDDLAGAELRVRELVADFLERHTDVKAIVSPSPHDRHHGHEVVARGVREALRAHPGAPAWWMWGLWATLPFPNVLVPFDDDRRNEIARALAAHAGETARNDYERLVGARGAANAVLGAELVFGFGAASRGHAYAELISEVVRHDGSWWLGPRRELDAANAFDARPCERADAWVDAPSLTELGAEA